MPLSEKSLIAYVLCSENTKDKFHLLSDHFFYCDFFKKTSEKN